MLLFIIIIFLVARNEMTCKYVLGDTGKLFFGAILKLCIESLRLGAKRFYFKRKYLQNDVELKKKVLSCPVWGGRASACMKHTGHGILSS